MRFHRLVVRNVTAHPVRAGLLFFFSALSLFLAVFLRSVLTTLDDMVLAASTDRLTVESDVGLFSEMPAAYGPEIAEVAGVEAVCRSSWFGGWHRDPSGTLPSLAVDLEAFLHLYPEIVLGEEERRALLSERRACVVGRGLAERFSLHVGDTFPVVGTLHPLPEGRPWEFVIRAIYRSSDPAFPETIHLFHWDFLDETRRGLSPESGSLVSVFLVKVAPGHAPADVAAAVDELHAGGPLRTHTQTEAAHRAEEVAMIGEIPTWLGLVAGTALLAMCIAVANAMGIAAGERAPQVGILRALGFPPSAAARLVLLESLAVVGLGGAAGTGLAYACVPLWRHVLGSTFSTYAVRLETVVLGCAVALAIAFIGGLPAALRLARARPLEVLRRTG